jgi:L-cysteate sulfo-lyase
MHCRELPRTKLGFFPTPVAALDRFSEKLGGPPILIKRDDQTGLALGGNKTRKLEFLMADALEQGCDTVITGGAGQSNHCRQTAAAAAACGLSCHLVLGGEAPPVSNGNLLLDRLLGAQLHWTGKWRRGEKIPEIAEELRRQGKRPYVVPYGGSNPIGAAAFAEAVRELISQLEEMGRNISHLVFASSSGGTQAGLIVGRAAFSADFEVIGIRIDKGEAGDGPYREHVLNLARATADCLGVEAVLNESDVHIRDDYLGQGYGIVGPAEREAVRMLAETEGILLDPVYTGRVMAGLIDMIRRDEFPQDSHVLFWHTGGSPALFPYAEDLLA